MCWEDVVIGRSSIPRQTVVAVGIGKAQLVPNNPQRTSLIIGAPSAGTMFISFSIADAANAGITMVAGQQPTQLDIFTDGMLATIDLYVAAPGGATTCTVWEAIVPQMPADILPPHLRHH